jgi:hypothetical protein
LLGIDGQHNSGEGSAVGQRGLTDHRAEIFAKTALMINAEHPSTVQTIVRPRYTVRSGVGSEDQLFWTNTYTAHQWYAGGPSRPELQRIAVNAFREFGVSLYLDPTEATGSSLGVSPGAGREPSARGTALCWEATAGFR